MIFLSFVFVCRAEQGVVDYPDWVYETPKPSNSTYVYVVEHGTALTELEAMNQAMGLVFKKAMERLGLPIDLEDINQAISEGMNYGKLSQGMRVPIDRVCKYVTRQNGQYVVYVLCQVAKDGIVDVQFDSFTDCSKRTIYEASMANLQNQLKREKQQSVARSFVPGMAQIYKSDVVKGTCFIAGEVLLLGGVVLSESLRANYALKIDQVSNATMKKRYANYANINATTRNLCIAGAVALYAWNVVDGVVAKGKKRVFIGETAQMNITPYTTFDEGGLAMNITF